MNAHAAENMRPTAVTHASTDNDLPPTLRMWFCIGCGSMGNFAGCADGCHMEPMEVVSAAVFADLFEVREGLRGKAEALAAVLHQLRTPVTSANDAERIWCSAKADANALLEIQKDGGNQSAMTAPDTESFSEIDRCAKCGAVESFQPCVGVCVRKFGEFVAREPYDAVAAEVTALTRDCDTATAMLRQFCSVTVRNGQWLANLHHFQSAAGHITLATDCYPSCSVISVAG